MTEETTNVVMVLMVFFLLFLPVGIIVWGFIIQNVLDWFDVRREVKRIKNEETNRCAN